MCGPEAYLGHDPAGSALTLGALWTVGLHVPNLAFRDTSGRRELR